MCLYEVSDFTVFREECAETALKDNTTALKDNTTALKCYLKKITDLDNKLTKLQRFVILITLAYTTWMIRILPGISLGKMRSQVWFVHA